MVNWKYFVKRIPNEVQIGSKTIYKVVWQNEIINNGHECYGMCDLNNKIIYLKLGMGPKITVESFAHECIHAFSHEHDVGLTENQVLKLEGATRYFLKQGNIFKK